MDSDNHQLQCPRVSLTNSVQDSEQDDRQALDNPIIIVHHSDEEQAIYHPNAPSHCASDQNHSDNSDSPVIINQDSEINSDDTE